METAQLSQSFLKLVKEVTQEHSDKGLVPCEFCYQMVPEKSMYLPDVMIGEVCTQCKKDLDAYNQGVVTNARGPLSTTAKMTRIKSTEPVTPEKAGVIGWIRDLIFKDEKISLVKLKGEMEDRGYKSATLSAQLGRVKRAYVVVNDFVYLNQECSVKLKEVRA